MAGRKKADYDKDDERYWKGWGERMERWGKRFGKRMESWGEGFGSKMEDRFSDEKGGKGRKYRGEWSHPYERRWRPWGFWFWPFGLLGPLIGAVFWTVIVVIFLWILKFLNLALYSPIIGLFINAAGANLQWFFAASLFIGYCKYFGRQSLSLFRLLWPAANAAGFTFAVWVLGWVFRVIGIYSGTPVFVTLGSLMKDNLVPVFALVLVLGYLLVAARALSRG